VYEVLYRLIDNMTALKPLGFWDFSRFQRLEKDLEILLADHLFDILFERSRLLPFHRERSRQPEGDIYALNEYGDIVIFELKRGTAGDDALAQLLRYAQKAAQWDYKAINERFRVYSKPTGENLDIKKTHQESFGLSEPLETEQFNGRQHMLVVGNAADEQLVLAVDYWKQKGLSIDFCPYRIYEIGGEEYFEFFAKPYDGHVNPGQVKGVLFDTCRTYLPNALRWMIEKKRVAAYGDRKEAVYSLSTGDFIFYSHRWVGLVAAAQVVGNQVKHGDSSEDGELYWDVKFLTPVPQQFDTFPNAMPFSKIKEVTGKNFFWAKILKVPYLSSSEAEHLLGVLNKHLAGQFDDEKTSGGNP
jgi:hypothetical protein